MYVCMCVCVCVCMYRPNGIMIRVFANSLGDRGSIPGQTKDSKNYRYRSRVSGVFQRKKYCSLLYLSVAAFEKRAFGSPNLYIAGRA